MVNGPVYGLDNWIYLAHEGPTQAVIYKDVFGDRGTPLRWPGHPQRPRSSSTGAACGCVRMPGCSKPTSGASQFGHGFDAWGRYFTTENADHARHEVMPARVARAQSRSAARLGDGADSGSRRGRAGLPHHKRPTFELLTGAGEFTSACAITPYTGGAFPDARRHVARSSPSRCTTSCTATC